MPHDRVHTDSHRAEETTPKLPRGRDYPVAVLPAAFAVSGGTYQRLVPCGCTWRRDET